MWQANRVEAIINNMGIETEIVGINSSGDKSLGGDLASSVGQFIHAVDAELISGSIDIAVHSSKDVPVTISDELTNLAYLERGYTNDVIIFRDSNGYHNLSDLLANRDESTIDQALAVVPKSGMVGTVSGRRQSFVLSKRPDIIPIAVRGQVETRLKRLQEGRVDAIILAEVGLQRLHQVGALEPWVLSMGAMRINDIDWPTAPGQGAISVHCRTGDLDNFADLRVALNHLPTESDVINERKILSAIGGGCLYPAGIKVAGDTVAAQISPKNWREIFCQGLPYDSQRYTGSLSDYQPVLPTTSIEPRELNSSGPKIISTLNSDRLARILQNNSINVINQPVIELVAKPENWPTSFLNDNTPRANWPYLVLTSPFAARCAVEVAEDNPDLKRIQWLAIGEGTARACFMRGVTVSICAQARNSVELVDYINRMISRDITLMIPRSDVASSDLVDRLNALGFSTKSWIGYENRTKQIPAMPVSDDDVLLLSSPSSARAWVENSLPIPKNILCMGKSSLAEIDSLGYFTDSTVEILQGPTSEFVAKWWKENRGD
jgi:hydroxymethylbilane synthase